MRKNFFIPGIYDYIFKTIMTNEEHIDYIQFIICEITGISKEELKDNFKILSTFLPVEHRCQKRGQVDILYQYGKNNYIDIEMNLEYSKSLLIKNNYYHCKIMAEKFYVGQTYENGKVIQINLNYFPIESKEERVNLYKVMNIYSHFIENENFIKFHINMENIYNSCYNKDNKELTLLERSLLVLMETDIKKLEKLAYQEKFLEKIVRRIIKMNDNEYCIGMYDKEDVDRKFQAMLRKEIEEDARKEGMEKGIKEGMEKGKFDSLMKVAKNMLNINMDISTIMSLTGLTQKQIESIK